MNEEYIHDLDFLEEGYFTPVVSENDLKFRAVSAACLVSEFHHAPLHTMDAFPSKAITASNNNIYVPFVPSKLSKWHFRCSTSMECTISAISKILASSTACKDYDCSYQQEEHMWKCKKLTAASVSEITVSLFRDLSSKDQIVEVKPIRGEGFRPCLEGLFEALQAGVTNCAAPVAKKGRLARCAPTLHRACSSSGATSDDDFLSGIAPILTMGMSCFLEPRLEAAKMLCDLAASATTSDERCRLIALPGCVEQCTTVLRSLLLDEEDGDVRQLSLVALAAFLRIGIPCYAKAMSVANGSSTIMELLATLAMSDCPVKELSYDCAQTRRLAAECLVLLSQSQPQAVNKTLGELGFLTAAAWQAHVGCLRDDRTRQFAILVGGSGCC
jgi:hypothetical protein